MHQFLEHILRTALGHDGGLSDGQLLERFLKERDEAAFEALVRRHGAMVLGVCRRVLGHVHDADDAFQATWLVLIRKAASIRPRERVGNWLYGVAYRTALEAKALRARRRKKERQAAKPEIQADAAPAELATIVDEEIRRLPEKYRLPLVLCDLEGRRHREVAQQLGWKEGTLSGRLSRARALLAKRLARRGVTLTATAVVGALSVMSASAWVPSVVASTVAKTVLLIAAGKATPTATVAALTQGVVKAMLMDKLKIAMALLLVLLAAGFTANGLMHQTRAADQAKTDTRELGVKNMLVLTKIGAESAILEKPHIKQINTRPFIVGLSIVDNSEPGRRFVNPLFPGKVVWIPLDEVRQMVELSERDEKEK